MVYGVCKGCEEGKFLSEAHKICRQRQVSEWSEA